MEHTTRTPFGYWLVCLYFCLVTAGAQALPPSGFVQSDVGRPDGGGWNEAVGITFDISERIFVWERGGKVWIVDEDNPVTTPFMDLTGEVGAWNDHGMLGFVLDPYFEQTGYVYAMYIVDRHFWEHCTEPSGDGQPSCDNGYSPNTDKYNEATFGRVVRYRAVKPSGESDYRNAVRVNPNSRRVLIGKDKTSGIPSTASSHVVGSLVFGTDGTLLISTGDGARSCGGPNKCRPDVGADPGTYAVQALADGIITPKEDIGAFRAQLIDSLNGKILRIDPTNGRGIASNPYYSSAAPSSPRSRVWALGFRNPFRMSKKPETGSHDPAAGDPGTLLIGDVGWKEIEEFSVLTQPAQNLGWPIFEGLEKEVKYSLERVENLDASNPLFGQSGCTQEFFYFTDLIQQDSLAPGNLKNPCNSSRNIPSSIPTFVHHRPLIDWAHKEDIARWASYSGNQAEAVLVGQQNSDQSKRVTGTPFPGNSSIGGDWYGGGSFPETYHNSYFHADFGALWIRNFKLNANNELVSVREFENDAGGVVFVKVSPSGDALYYISWTVFLRKVVYNPTGSFPPTARIDFDRDFGPSPLTVQFDGSGSTDPEEKPLTYRWDFGDGSNSNSVSPSHTFSSGNGQPREYTVKLTVTDPGGAKDSQEVAISVNNTPPQIRNISPAPGTLYSIERETRLTLSADLVDTESPNNLSCAWEVILHHDNHSHSEPVQYSCAGNAVIEPLGCGEETYYYVLRLSVFDAHGLADSEEVTLLPDCGGASPSADAGPDQTVTEGDTVRMDASGSSDDGRIERYEWVQTAGSQSLSLAETVAPEFIAPAPLGTSETYEWVLRVYDDEGAIGTDTVQIVINRSGGGNLPPSADFSASPVVGNLTVGFDASASDDSDGSIANYAWDFGDGQSGTGRAPSHSYASFGTYSVTLTVTDDEGAMANHTRSVTLSSGGGGGDYCPSGVCDNTDSGFVPTGNWVPSTENPGYLGSNYLHDGNVNKGKLVVAWNYMLSEAGEYEVAAQWSESDSHSDYVKYTYRVNGGSAQACGSRANQRRDGGQMNVLCKVNLPANTAFTVQVRNGTNAGFVVADAVRVQSTSGGGGGGNQPPSASFTAPTQTDSLSVNFDASASGDTDGSIASYAWNFGDGQSGSGIAPQHSYAAYGTYSVTLTVTDNEGATDSMTQSVTLSDGGGGGGGDVCPMPVCDNTDSGFGAVGKWSTSTRNAGFLGSNYQHDGNTDKGNRVATWTYRVSEAGQYELAARWSQASNRATNVQYRYQINGGTAQACGSPLSQRQNGAQMNVLCRVSVPADALLTIQLRNDATGGYVIADSVRVQSTSGGGGGNQPPSASFTAPTQTDSLSVNFDASASGDTDGSIASYAWSFGDGQSGSGIAQQHSYAAYGTYSVTLTVTDNEGATDSMTQSVTLSDGGGGGGGDVCPMPVCDNTDSGFDAVGKWSTSTRNGGFLGSNYQHDGNTDKGNRVATWTYRVSEAGQYELAARWSQASNRATNVQYRYQINGGTAQACGSPLSQRQNGAQMNVLCQVSVPADALLTVQLRNDATGGYVIADSVRLQQVGTGGNILPTARFVSQLQSGTMTVNLDGTGSDDVDGSITGYSWDFGDGNSGSGAQPSHQYASAGTFSVVLTVTDNQGAQSQTTRTVTVGDSTGQACAVGICDDLDIGFNTVGVWGRSTSYSGFYGERYRHDKKAVSGSRTASWTYAINQDGTYAVAAQWSQANNRSSDVQYRYAINGGSEQACGARVNQRENGNRMNTLCQVSGLQAGDQFTIILRNDNSSGGYVIADAVRIQKQ